MSLWKTVRSFFGGSAAGKSEQEISDANFKFVEKDDPEMVATWEKARASIPDFIEMVDDPSFADADFYVKKKFEQDDRTEHLWLSLTEVGDKEFIGLVGNDPRIVTNVKCNDAARVAFDEISDWMIMRGGAMVGGFTVEERHPRNCGQIREGASQHVWLGNVLSESSIAVESTLDDLGSVMASEDGTPCLDVALPWPRQTKFINPLRSPIWIAPTPTLPKRKSDSGCKLN
jgi:uncharacterized protein YegJ (DUF2314 family)